MPEPLTLKTATIFFGQLFGGVHHIPGCKVTPIGIGGFKVKVTAPMATYDNALLTKLVVMAHEESIRVEIAPERGQCFSINIFQRQRDGEYYERHPTMEDATKFFKENRKEIVWQY